MKRFLLDTGSASDYVHRLGTCPTRVAAAASAGDRIGICVPILGELYAGIELSVTRARNLQRLHRALSSLSVWPYDPAAAAEYGRLFALLRRLGRPIQQIDIQIAAVAFTLGNTTVVTRDSDFAAVPGLQVEDWSTP